MERPWQDEDTLRDLYLNREMSQPEIADELGCSPKTIDRWMRKFGIEARSRSESVSKASLSSGAREVLTDKSEPRRLYHGDGKSLPEIADEIGCSHKTVDNWMIKHGIDKRTISDSLNGQQLSEDGKRILMNPDRLRELYAENPTRVIAGMADCHTQTVINRLERYGLETREPGSHNGELNHQYKHGESLNYGPDWPEKRSERLEYDDYKCVVCGMSDAEHQAEYGCGLNIHHIKPLHEFDGDYQEANRMRNLITLCVPHHSKWEGIPVRPEVSND